MSLKWVFGEPQEKSPILNRKCKNNAPKQDSCVRVGHNDTVPSLPTDDNVCLQTINKNACVEIIRPKSKEELYDRINSRELIDQIAQNPFHTNSYVEDIANQDKFLRSRAFS